MRTDSQSEGTRGNRFNDLPLLIVFENTRPNWLLHRFFYRFGRSELIHNSHCQDDMKLVFTDINMSVYVGTFISQICI